MTRSLLVWPLVCAACAQGSNDGLGLDGVDGDASPGGGSGVEAGTEDSAEPTGEIDAAVDAGDGSADSASQDALGNDGSDDATSGEGLDDAMADATGDDATTGPGPDAAGACGCGARSVCVAGTCTAARRVFVSNETYGGALGGHAGADATCQALATGAALGGTWMAWISDSTSSPSQRFSIPTVGYFLLDATPIATSWAALTASGPTHAIDLTETGASLASASADGSKTWTATLVTGALGTASCSDFGSSSVSETGEVGHCTGTGTVNWTSAYATEECDVLNHLYCFEQ
jgi:hypothetical protein